MAFDFSTLVTDRTQQDVVYAKQLIDKLVTGTATDAELAAWNSATLKGAYNYTDLNRVIAAMEYLRERLEGYGYALDGYVQDNHVWQEEDNPKPAQLAQYLANVAAIRAALAVLPTTPAAPTTMEKLTVEEANAIEKIMADVDTVIRSMLKIVPQAMQPMVYCGFVIYAAHKEPEIIDNHVYTLDGLAVYTLDGLAVLVR